MRSLKCVSRRSLVSAAFGLAGVFQLKAEEPNPQAPGYNRMTDEQEIELGRKAAGEIEKELKLQFIEDNAVCEYAGKLLESIAKTSRRPKLPYSIKVINGKDINAFALPGGFLYMYRGLMEWARSEQELAAVLGHEVGHVVGRHGANTVARATAADSLLSEASRILLGDELPATILKQIGGPAAFLALLKYSRAQEFEADLLGYYNLQRAEISSQGVLDLFQHFSEGGSALDSWFAVGSSHPAPSERAAQIRQEMAKYPPKTISNPNSDRFRAMQAALKKIPAAPKKG
jgi:beta-barrel assembly-enhancing protease